MYLLVIIRHTLIPSLNISNFFVLRSFRSLTLNGIWLDQNPTLRSSVTTVMDSVATVRVKYLHFLYFDLKITFDYLYLL
jgi:hypothetical protein